MNCPNPVGPMDMFCSEKCADEWDVKKFEENKVKKAKARRKKKIRGIIIGGCILVASLLLGLYFIPLYDTGILRQQENYPKTYQIDDCAVSYDIKTVNGSSMIFPTRMVCDQKPNQTESDQLVSKINHIADELTSNLISKHPELKSQK